MVETIIGYGTLIVFVVVLALTLFRKINLPIQTVLILITLFNVVVAVFWRFFADGYDLVFLGRNGNDRRFLQDDSFASQVDQYVNRTQVNPQFFSKHPIAFCLFAFARRRI